MDSCSAFANRGKKLTDTGTAAAHFRNSRREIDIKSSFQ
jgi:hypothetical protein